LVNRLSASNVAQGQADSPARGYQLGVDFSFRGSKTSLLCRFDFQTIFGGRSGNDPFQTPKDIGEMAAFLASDRAENITGAAFNVDGG
jgi:NAD(P)-dependent dehydrogenase (short-subunit alcohol dehydrogenase family)